MEFKLIDMEFSKLSRACMGAFALMASTAAFAQAPTCNAAPGPDCLYFPSASYGFTTSERTTTYTDIAGDLRGIKFLIRQPTGAPAPMPAVVWSHGGAYGKLSPATSMVEWSETTARAGYLTVSIAHTPRDEDSRRHLCGVVGITDRRTCKHFKYLNLDRPYDIRAVLDEMHRLANGDLRGQIDMERVAVGGHSAGAGGAQTVAGARRIFVGPPVEISDPRPVAFLAFSPQQPGSEGFFDTRFGKLRHSWTAVQRPVLTATGDGDSTCDPGLEPGSCIGDTPFGRRLGFQRMPAGNKYHLYLHDADAFHTLFELNEAKCPRLNVDPQRCAEVVRWLTSTGLAFLDAHVRHVPAALQWLQSTRIEQASGGVAEWQRK
jgi:poly(3-hydroxybutyrate) depolymerase